MTERDLFSKMFHRSKHGLIIVDCDLEVKSANLVALQYLQNSLLLSNLAWDFYKSGDDAIRHYYASVRELLTQDPKLKTIVRKAASKSTRVFYAVKTASLAQLTCELYRISDPDEPPLVAIEIIKDHKIINKMLDLNRDVINERTRAVAARIASRNLESTNTKLKRFAFAAAHDIQEPVRIIALLSDLLETESENLERQAIVDYLREIGKQARRARRIVVDILEFSKVSEIEIEWTRSDLKTIFDECLAEMSNRIASLNCDINVDGLGRIDCDRRMMHMLFHNLISNAIKYRKGNDLSLTVVTEDYADFLEISVRDKGIGFDPIHAESIFEVFHRLHRNDEIPGSGVGLSLCKSVIERHGGDIWAEGEPGKGACFHLRLPKRQDFAPEKKPRRRRPVAA